MSDTMTFEQFKAEAEKWGLTAHDDGDEWLLLHGHMNAIMTYYPIGMLRIEYDATPYHAIRAALELTGRGVTARLREWLKSRDDVAMVRVAIVLAKLDELEGEVGNGG